MVDTLTERGIATMRKIERNMLAAIHNGSNYSEGNTQVTFNGNLGAVYLHGNRIATIAWEPIGLPVVTADSETFNRWPTMTTGSRLHALGIPNKASRDGDANKAWHAKGAYKVRQPDDNA